MGKREKVFMYLHVKRQLFCFSFVFVIYHFVEILSADRRFPFGVAIGEGGRYMGEE